jgi:integrase
MAGKLTARGAATTKAGQYSDGGGLYLRVANTGARNWIYRFTFRGRIKMMGLGSAEIVTLAEARDLRNNARRKVAAGINPIEERRLERQRGASFGDFAEIVIERQAAQSRNDKHKFQWRHSLEVHAKDLWSRPVADIKTEHVLGVLKPLWSKIPETASRLRGRIEMVLDAARALGAIPEDRANPARWKGHLALLLPAQDKLARSHQPALPYAEVAEFIAALSSREATTALALEFQILTAARPGEALGAQWSEFDLAEGVWTIPPVRHKTGKTTGKPHVVPLSKRAVEIIKIVSELRAGASDDSVFLGNKGQPLSDMALRMLMRRMSKGDRQWMDPVQNKPAVPHGFRSSFRDWAGDETHFQREVIEAALAHVVSGVEGDYRRGDAFKKRRALMEAWEAYCFPAAASNVVSIKSAGAH